MRFNADYPMGGRPSGSVFSPLSARFGVNNGEEKVRNPGKTGREEGILLRTVTFCSPTLIPSVSHIFGRIGRRRRRIGGFLAGIFRN